jgi:ATP synthase I chain
MGTSPPELAEAKFAGAGAVRRIPWLTLIIGFAAAVGTELFSRQWRWAVGLVVGTVLGWLNFWLLVRGAEILLRVRPAQESSEKSRLPIWELVFRYGLIGLSVYVSFKYLHVPLASLIAGLCAFGVATIASSVWVIVNPEGR